MFSLKCDFILLSIFIKSRVCSILFQLRSKYPCLSKCLTSRIAQISSKSIRLQCVADRLNFINSVSTDKQEEYLWNYFVSHLKKFLWNICFFLTELVLDILSFFLDPPNSWNLRMSAAVFVIYATIELVY